jgi:hypothetical protein
LPITTKAGIETTDRITISELTVDPGGDAASFDVSLEGSDVIYTAFEVTLQLPEGLTVDYSGTTPKPRVSLCKPSLYPYTEEAEEKSYTHTLSCSYGTIGERKLKVMCYSSANEDFTATSGSLFRVYVKASPFMKPGEAKITSENVYFTTKDEVEYDVASEEFPLTVTGQSTVQLNVAAENQWNTCVLPFDAELPEGVRAFEGSSISGDYLILSEATSLQAFTPYILYAENGYEGTLSGTVDAEKYVTAATGAYLNGAIMPQEITEGYVMQDKGLGDGMMFYNVNNRSFTIPSGKCWVSAAAGDAKAIRIGLGGTGIESLPSASQTEEGEVYTLDGKRVQNPQKGNVYIKGGKKVLYLK